MPLASGGGAAGNFDAFKYHCDLQRPMAPLLSVDSTLNDAEDQCYEAWRVAERQVYRFGCTGLEALEVLLKFTTSKCVQVIKFLN